MLENSDWNAPGALVVDGEFVGADEGYYYTRNVAIVKPISKEKLEAHPECKEWNKAFNLDRGLIERTFGILKSRFKIFDLPWKRHKELFPIALRVSLKLLNRYWRLDGNMSPGLKWQYERKRIQAFIED